MISFKIQSTFTEKSDLTLRLIFPVRKLNKPLLAFEEVIEGEILLYEKWCNRRSPRRNLILPLRHKAGYTPNREEEKTERKRERERRVEPMKKLGSCAKTGRKRNKDVRYRQSGAHLYIVYTQVALARSRVMVLRASRVI